jgi:hypothetical protein
MSDTSGFGFGKFVPGFDFLQSLAKTAGQSSSATNGLPGMSSWVAPTLSVEELDKRIQELKAVQFWLEQNGTALKATIQALEVQKMTLSTLESMNVNMADLAKAFTAKVPGTPASAAPATQPGTAPEDEPHNESAAETQKAEASTNKGASKRRSQKAKADKPAVDPMAWWGSLTQQFQNIAAAAIKDVATDTLKAQDAQAKAPAATKKTAHKAPAKTARKAANTSARAPAKAPRKAPTKTKR